MFVATFGGKPVYSVYGEQENLLRLGLPIHPDLSKANSVWNPRGARAAKAYFLMRRSDLAALDLDDLHDLTFTYTGANTETITFVNLSVSDDPLNLYPSALANNPDALYLVEASDARHRVHNSTFWFTVNKNYNTRAYSNGAAAFVTASLNTGVAWTWQEIVTDLWTLFSSKLGSAPTLPVTPTSTPEGFVFQGVSAWLALCEVLDRIGCEVACNLETGVYSIVRVGAADAATETLLSDTRRIHDGEYISPGRGLPAGVRVFFNRQAGLAYTVDVAGSADSPETSVYHPIWDKALAIYDTAGSLTNSADLDTRAAELSADYYRRMDDGGDRRWLIYSGLLAVHPGSQVSVVSWREWEDGITTEVVRTPRLPEFSGGEPPDGVPGNQSQTTLNFNASYIVDVVNLTTESVTVQNNLTTVSGTTVTIYGSTVNISNSGTWTFSSTTVNINSGTWTYQNTVNITGGTWTFSSTTVNVNSGTWTYNTTVNFTSVTNLNSLNQLTVTNTTAISLGSNQNNYAIVKYFTNIEPSANIQITGISYTSVAVGVMIVIFNSASDYYIELTNEDGSSSASNQFSFPWKTSFFLAPKEFIKLYYNGSKWVPKFIPQGAQKPYAPAQITSNQDNYDLLYGVRWWKMTTDAARNITGFQKGYCGRLVHIFNGGSFTITLQHQTTSTAANQFYTQNAQDYRLQAGCGVWLLYDCDISRWRVMDCCTGAVVRKNSTGSDYQRRRLNFIEGSNVTLTVSDDSANDEVDITIAASAAGTTGTNGETVMSSDYTITDTWGDSGLDVTLGVAGTYLVQGDIMVEAEVSALSTGAEIWLRFYNETDAAAVASSGTLAIALLATGLRYKATVPIGRIITTDSDNEVIRLEAQQNSNSPTWTFSKVMASYTDFETRLRYIRLA